MKIFDKAKSLDGIGVKGQVKLQDKGLWKGRFYLTKWNFGTDDIAHAAFDLASKAGKTFEELKEQFGKYFISHDLVGENLLTNYGINSIIWPAVAGGTYTAMNNTNGRLGVGDSTTAAAATQTDLQAATNKAYQAMDATYPTYGSSQQIVFRATFASGAANYAWQEFISDNGTAGHAMNRLVSAQGTKTSGQSWQLTLTITLS